jgi:hypothetical protein
LSPGGRTLSEAEVERLVSARMDRHAILDQAEPRWLVRSLSVLKT